jgi:hypothetical protein
VLKRQVSQSTNKKYLTRRHEAVIVVIADSEYFAFRCGSGGYHVVPRVLCGTVSNRRDSKYELINLFCHSAQIIVGRSKADTQNLKQPRSPMREEAEQSDQQNVVQMDADASIMQTEIEDIGMEVDSGDVPTSVISVWRAPYIATRT